MFIDADFGESFRTVDRSVNKMIAEQFPASARIGIFALIVGVTTGLAMGVLAALYRNSAIDRLAMIMCVTGVAIPSLLVAYMLQYFLAVWPRTHMQVNDDYWFRPVGWGEIRDLILPGMTLSFGIIAVITRYMRSQMVDVSFMEYIRTAKAKGVSTLRLVFSHQIRNAILPVVTLLGPLITFTISGSIVVESVFGVPGLGTAYVNSITNNDYNVLMGLTVFFGGFFVLMNLLIDILYGLIDPRIRFG
jgi:oligopeptide transport system permease protein